MYKFMIASNPLKGGRVFILHTPSPSCLIEVLTVGNDTDKQNKGKTYTHRVNSEKKEIYQLVVSKSLESTTGFSDISEFDQILDRAWKWYVTLLNKQTIMMIHPLEKPVKA
jgi:hypothetical protein